MKRSFFLLFFAVSLSAFSNEFKMDCDYIGEDGKVVSTITATSREYDFDESFSSPYMPTTVFIKNVMPDIFAVRAQEQNGDKVQRLDLFVTDWMQSSKLSEQSEALVSETGVQIELIKKWRLVFPTDLYSTLTYVEIVLKNGHGPVVKLSVAGLYMGVCK